MQINVLDSIFHQIIFTTNCLGHQRTTALFFQPLTLQTVPWAAVATHCALSENNARKITQVIFSWDKYWGKFCLSTVIDFITAEATALINYKSYAASYHPLELFRSHWFSLLPIGACQPWVILQYFIPHSRPLFTNVATQSAWYSSPSSWSTSSLLQTIYPISVLLRLHGCCFAGCTLINPFQYSLA